MAPIHAQCKPASRVLEIVAKYKRTVKTTSKLSRLSSKCHLLTIRVGAAAAPPNVSIRRCITRSSVLSCLLKIGSFGSAWIKQHHVSHTYHIAHWVRVIELNKLELTSLFENTLRSYMGTAWCSSFVHRTPMRARTHFTLSSRSSSVAEDLISARTDGRWRGPRPAARCWPFAQASTLLTLTVGCPLDLRWFLSCLTSQSRHPTQTLKGFLSWRCFCLYLNLNSQFTYLVVCVLLMQWITTILKLVVLMKKKSIVLAVYKQLNSWIVNSNSNTHRSTATATSDRTTVRQCQKALDGRLVRGWLVGWTDGRTGSGFTGQPPGRWTPFPGPPQLYSERTKEQEISKCCLERKTKSSKKNNSRF